MNNIKNIIVNADDFGMSKVINEAIIETFKVKNINSTTLMVNMPGTLHAVELAKINQALQVGLHFCITEGPALTGISTLTDRNGIFLSRHNLIKKFLMLRIKKGDIFKEFEAQLQKFDSFGISISHVDSHQHLHMLPQVFYAILPLVESRHLAMRMVCPIINHGLVLKRPFKYIKQIINFFTYKFLKNKFHGKTNDCLVSIHDLVHHEKIDSNIYDYLICKTGKHKYIELMVHPFPLMKEVKAKDFKGSRGNLTFEKLCELEYNLLIHNKIVNNPNYKIINYRDI
jgi:predicted glycoside hydrolase/deacetylase ChbG (UPF0249 family)